MYIFVEHAYIASYIVNFGKNQPSIAIASIISSCKGLKSVTLYFPRPLTHDHVLIVILSSPILMSNVVSSYYQENQNQCLVQLVHQSYGLLANLISSL